MHGPVLVERCVRRKIPNDSAIHSPPGRHIVLSRGVGHLVGGPINHISLGMNRNVAFFRLHSLIWALLSVRALMLN